MIERVIQMLRWRTAMLLLLFVAIADAASKHSLNDYSPRLVLVALVLGGWYIFSTSINDLADEAIDKINLKGYSERPLANSEISRQRLWLLALGGGLAALLLSCLISTTSLGLTFGALTLSFIYSWPPIHISYRGILAPLMLPIGYVLFPLLLVVEANRFTPIKDFWLLAAALYVSFVGRIILKDFRDVKGDRRFGKRTFIVRHGARATCYVSFVAWVVGDGLIVWRFFSAWLFILLLQPFVLAIFYLLPRLARESKIKRQISFVGLIGRLANGTALLTLALLYKDLAPMDKQAIYNLLLVTLGAFNAYAAYVLYQPLLSKAER